METALIIAIISIMIIGAAVAVAGAAASRGLEVEKIAVENGGAPIKVAHISDLHYPQNGASLEEIKKAVEEAAPDLIFLTGDIIDRHASRGEIENLSSFLAELNSGGNVYAVLGNHEATNAHLEGYREVLRAANITLLENEYHALDIGGKRVTVAGLSDDFPYGLDAIFKGNQAEGTILLLAHRPEHVDLQACKVKPLVTFCGHAHGGQFRFFGRGLLAPGQGFFPRYTSGIYSFDGYHMVVSRGLGKSVIPFRLFNPYHLPVVEIC